jgi:hypothetical protein
MLCYNLRRVVLGTTRILLDYDLLAQSERRQHSAAPSPPKVGVVWK